MKINEYRKQILNEDGPVIARLFDADMSGREPHEVVAAHARVLSRATSSTGSSALTNFDTVPVKMDFDVARRKLP